MASVGARGKAVLVTFEFRTAGITVRDRLATRLKKEGQPRRRMRHYVFARVGEPCRICGASIEKEQIASRRIYRCPGCQSGS